MNHFVPTCEPKRNSRTQLHSKVSPIQLSSQALKRLEFELPANRQGRSAKSSFYRSQIRNRLEAMREGSIHLSDGDNSTILGDYDCGEQRMTVNVEVHDPAFYKKTFWGGTIGAAESYLDGDWSTDDLTCLVRLMIRNLEQFTNLEKSWAWVRNRIHYFQHMLRRNTISGSRRNIHEHYDLGNDFYQLFLDPTMNYSSGIFSSAEPEAADRYDMVQASQQKMKEVCERLELTADDHVLEIGTGWGGLAMFMAANYGCRVTTCTISKEQFLLAKSRVRKAGLEGQIEIILEDYRNLEGTYDKIVSIEMIEAVGHQYYDRFFGQCDRLLKEHGRLFLQAITIGEQHYDQHVRKVDFIRKYVFPGGCLPAISALNQSVGRATDMRMIHQYDLTAHYVKTLYYWRTQFLAKLDQVKELGYDSRFIRLWNFYLCYCEAAFAERRVHCTHLMFGKPGCKW